jgi:uncharacterized membrane protein
MPSPRAIEEAAVAAEQLLMRSPTVAAAAESAARLGAEALAGMGKRFGVSAAEAAEGAAKPGAVSGAFRSIFDHSSEILPKGQHGFVSMFEQNGSLVAKFDGGPLVGAKATWKPGDPLMHVEMPNGYATKLDRFPTVHKVHVDNQGFVHMDPKQALHPTEH